MDTLISISAGIVLLSIGLYYLRNRMKSSSLSVNNDVLIKYKTFIDLALEQGKTSRIEKIKSNSLSIRTSAQKSASVFTLTEVHGRIIIVWTWSDIGFGRRGKEWSFPENYNQKKMFEEVVEDVLSYQIATYQKHNQQATARL